MLNSLQIALLAIFTFSSMVSQSSLLLQKIPDIPLPGETSRFDYESLDAKNGLLFIAHMGAGQVVVFDVKAQKVIGTIDGLPGVTGVLAVPSFNRVYASVTGIGAIAVIDEDALRIVGKVPGGDFPDGIAYDPEDEKLFVSDEKGGTVTVISARTNRKVDLVSLGGEVGNTQYDPLPHLIYSNVQSRNQLVAIDPRTHRIVNRFQLHGGEHPHGLLIETSPHTAFIACDGDSKLLVFDLNRKQVVAVFQVGEAPDVLSFDPGLRRLYVASESGVISVFKEEGSELKKEGDLFVAAKAHSITVDPQTHRVYLPIQNVNDRPVLRIMEPIMNH